MEIPVFELYKAYSLNKETLIEVVHLASVLYEHCLNNQAFVLVV